jgi:predicted transcriptional regulator
MAKLEHDHGLDDLIELDGVVLVVDPLGNYWVKFVVTSIAASDKRPHGISYSLTIHAADGELIVGFDNAHAVNICSGPSLHIEFNTRSLASLWHDQALQVSRRAGAVTRFLERGRCHIEREGKYLMKILRIGIASYQKMKERTMAIACGELKPGNDEPKLWFTSIESLARVLSDKNRTLLNLIIEQQPKSIAELETLSGRAKSNLSRTLKSMERFGLVELLKGEGSAVCPRVPYKEIQIDLPFAHHQREHFEALR